MKRCPACGRDNPDTNTLCFPCGAPLPGTAAPAPPLTAPSPSPAPKAAPPTAQSTTASPRRAGTVLKSLLPQAVALARGQRHRALLLTLCYGTSLMVAGMIPLIGQFCLAPCIVGYWRTLLRFVDEQQVQPGLLLSGFAQWRQANLVLFLTSLPLLLPLITAWLCKDWLLSLSPPAEAFTGLVPNLNDWLDALTFSKGVSLPPGQEASAGPTYDFKPLIKGLVLVMGPTGWLGLAGQKCFQLGFGVLAERPDAGFGVIAAQAWRLFQNHFVDLLLYGLFMGLYTAAAIGLVVHAVLSKLLWHTPGQIGPDLLALALLTWAILPVLALWPPLMYRKSHPPIS